MKQRFLPVLLSALCLTFLFSSALRASDTQVDGIWYNFYSSTLTASVSYRGSSFSSYSNEYSGSVVIPETVTYNGIEYRVTSIGYRAFYNCSGLTSVTIPNSVTSIGNYAFEGCYSLPVIDNIRYADTYLVEAADKTLSTYTIKEGTKWIGYDAFRGCSSLTSITIPNSVTSIGDDAFYNCSTLTSVTIGESVTSIGDRAFYNCSGLTSVTIPNSVTSIGNYAFEGCYSLPVIDNIRYADTYLVGAVNKTLSTYTIKEGTKWIGYDAFRSCSSLTSITIPNSVTSIEEGAFMSCCSLTSITIPNSVTSIRGSAFRDCSSLTSVTIGESVKSIGGYAFDGCSTLTSVTIGESVTSIGDYAFYECSGLTSIEIPNSVTSIGDEAFYGCSGLTSPVYNAHVFAFMPTSYSGAYTIPDGIESIAGSAFRGCSSLTSVTIPNSVTYIKSSTFLGCYRLTSVTIPNSVTAIGERAFEGCGLTYVTIPNSVTSIYLRAFYHCNGLSCLFIPNSVTSIENLAFEGVKLLIYSGSATGSTWGAHSVIKGYIEDGLVYEDSTKTDLLTCYNAEVLDVVTIPESVTRISTYCSFIGCDSLTTVVWKAQNCIDFPFYNIRNQIISFSFGEKVKSIPEKLCYGMKSLSSVTIPNSVTSIGNNAFYGCKGLKFLSLGEGITSYGDYAFQGCSALTTIYNYRERPAKLGTDVFKDVDYFNCTLHVLAGSVDMYKSAGSDWKDFYFVEPIGAASTTTEKVEITPTDNTAGFVWPTVNNAASYELVIKDKEGNDVCTLIFDAQGHLTQIAFTAPDRNRAPEQTAEQVAGFSFTITGLNSGTTYDYTLTAKDAAGNVLDTKTGTFTTDGLTGIDDIPSSIDLSSPTKVFENGQLYIFLPNGTRYNLQGTEVK